MTELRKCKICPVLFELQPSKKMSLYCSEDCRKAGKRLSYAKWKKNNPEKLKMFQSSQCNQRKRDGRVKVKNSYRDTPILDQWPCRDCGRMSHNRLYCPTCHHQRSKDVSQEYPDCIYDIEVSPMDATSLKDGLRSEVI